MLAVRRSASAYDPRDPKFESRIGCSNSRPTEREELSSIAVKSISAEGFCKVSISKASASASATLFKIRAVSGLF